MHINYYCLKLRLPFFQLRNTYSYMYWWEYASAKYNKRKNLITLKGTKITVGQKSFAINIYTYVRKYESIRVVRTCVYSLNQLLWLNSYPECCHGSPTRSKEEKEKWVCCSIARLAHSRSTSSPPSFVQCFLRASQPTDRPTDYLADRRMAR